MVGSNRDPGLRVAGYANTASKDVFEIIDIRADGRDAVLPVTTISRPRSRLKDPNHRIHTS